MHVAEPAVEYVPIAHKNVQLEALPEVAEYFPASQFVHTAAPPAAHVPATHCSVHDVVRPVVGENVPPPQATHVACPGLTWYFPAGHIVQAAAPAGENQPAAHTSVHDTTRPVEAEKYPDAQFEQLPCPALAWYVPAEHDVQLVDPEPEYFPVAQEIVHAPERPVTAENLPAAQLMQDAAPALEYVPTLQMSAHATCR